MKHLRSLLGLLVICSSAWGETRATEIHTDRYTFSLPEGFQALKPQTLEGRTKWTYLREGVAGYSDCRFRVTILEGSKPIPDDQTAVYVALALLVDFTSQQTKSLGDLHYGAASRVAMHDRTWWCVPWSGTNGSTSIAGRSYLTTAFGAGYFLVFETLSPEEGSKVSSKIIESFKPKKRAD